MNLADVEKWIKDNEESLVKQSRSFTIPILNLDDRFRIPVMVEYNLNKTIDTIEDSTAFDADEKINLIGKFCEQLKQDNYSREVQKRMLEVTPKEEAFVFKNYESTINLFNTLSKSEKKLARKWTCEMAGGMCEFLKRSIETIKDLNDYCYFVAGTVGLYLTELLRINGNNITEKAFHKLEDNAVPFGLFLQKLNIIRDHEEDIMIKKRFFWPENYFENEKDPVKILNRMCFETLKNDAPRAIEYFKAIPSGNESFDYFIRFALSSGMEYLKILKNNVFVFSKKKVKLPGIFIKHLYATVSSLNKEEFGKYCDQLRKEEIEQYGGII